MIIKKAVGYAIYVILAKHIPASFKPLGGVGKAIRAFCGKLILDECGKNVNIEKGAVFSSRCTIGDNSGIGISSVVSGPTHIGNCVMMGPECRIFTRNHKFSNLEIPMCEQGFSEEKPVYISDDVWIGERVMIMPGVQIGKGAIIGAGAVVTKDIPDYAIAAGNPAIVKKFRSKD